MFFSNPFGANVPEILPHELKQKIDAGEDMFLLDVREAYEYNEARIDNTTLIPRGALESSHSDYRQEIETLKNSKDKEVIVICRSGMRSLVAGQRLMLMGFSNVKSLKTGVMGWASNGFPISSGVAQTV